MNSRAILTRILNVSLCIGLGLSVAACDDGAKKADTKKADAKADDSGADPAADAKADDAKADDTKADDAKADAKADDTKADAEEAEAGDAADEGGDAAAEGGDAKADDAKADDAKADDAKADDAKADDKKADKKADDKKADDKKADKKADKKDDSASAAASGNGKELYLKKCKNCHGTTGAADTKIGQKNDIASWKEPGWKGKWPMSKVENIVKNGKSGTKMKPFKDKLTADEIKAVSKYARSLGK